MRLLVQQGGKTHEFELPESAKVEHLHEQLEAVGIPKRRQKLIYKGKTLLPHHDLSQAKLSNGAKIMLLVSGGPTMGQAEAAKEEARKQDLVAQRKLRNEERDSKALQKQQALVARKQLESMEVRSVTWAKTGIVALRDASLTELPAQVWQTGYRATTLDLTNNRLTELPHDFAKLTQLERLSLAQNLLDKLPEGLALAFQRLQALSVSQNRLVDFPEICLLPGLKNLDLSCNLISSLPADMRALTSLSYLNLSGNTLASLPEQIGQCTALADLDLSANRLSSLSLEVRKLQELRNLQLKDNRLSCIPGEILRECGALQTINLHGNPITIEQLRESEDFKVFDERRRTKYTKQMDMRLMSSVEGFDEGADQMEFDHFRKSR